MFTRKVSLVAITALLAVGLFGALAPTAVAQAGDATTTEVILGTLNEPIKPLSGSKTISGSVKYTYFSPTATPIVVGTQIQLKVVESPSWAVVTVTPSSIVIPVGGAPSGAQQVAESQFKVIISTTADAPAFNPANIRIQADAGSNQPLKPSTGSSVTQITADYFSIIDARTDSPIQIARPQSNVAYPVIVQNFGNADTKVTFGIESATEDLTVVPPIPFTLQARQNGGKQIQQQAIVNVQTPYQNGYLNKVGSATIRITSNYALDTEKKGDSSQVTILTTTKGFYVPGASPVFLLGLLGAVAVIAKTSRRRN